jgi:hypothetical protein
MPEVNVVMVPFTRGEVMALLGKLGAAQYGPREELASAANKLIKASQSLLPPEPAKAT